MTLTLQKLINPTDKKDYAISFSLAAMIAIITALVIDGVAYFTLGYTSVGTWYNKYWLVFLQFALLFLCAALFLESLY